MTQNKLEFREMRVTKRADMKLTEHERNKANFDSSLMMPNLIHWEFKQLPPSLELDDMIRCILLCHECVRLEEKVIFKKDFLALLDPKSAKCDTCKIAHEPRKDS